MNIQNQIVAAARGYIGTQYHHQGRTPGIELDCAGLVICAARDAGLSVVDKSGYDRTPDGFSFIDHISSQMHRVDFECIEPGDVLAFTFFERLPQHAAIVTEVSGSEISIVHAHETVGRVVEHRIDALWRRRMHSAWRFRKAS